MTDEPQGTEVAQTNGLRFSESVENIAPAFLQVQKQVEDPPRSGENPHFGSRYVTLEDLIHTVRPVLTANGISLHQAPGMENGEVTVETVLLHESGEWARSTAQSPMQRDDPQGVGSAISYLRRYSLASMLGLVHETDDDANRASAPRQSGTSDTPETLDVEAVPWFGKYADEGDDGPKTWDWVVRNRPDYIKWLAENTDKLTSDHLDTLREHARTIQKKRQPEQTNGGAPSGSSEAEGAPSDVPGEPAAKEEVQERLSEEYGTGAVEGKLSEFGFKHPTMSASPEKWTEAEWAEVLEGLERHGMAYIQAPDEVLSGEGAS